MPEGCVNCTASAPEAQAGCGEHRGWGTQQHPGVCVCVPAAQRNALASGGCQVLLSQAAPRTVPLVGEQPRPTCGSRPADQAQRCWRLQHGEAHGRAGGTRGSERLAGTACQRAELLSKQLREGGKQSWKKNLPVSCPMAIHFFETKRLYKGSA